MGDEGRERILTVKEVADWLLFGVKTIREMCSDGEFEGAFTARGEWRIPESSVTRYIARQQAESRR